MTLITRFWHVVVDFTTWLATSPLGSPPSQHPLGVPLTHVPEPDLLSLAGDDRPVFRPPAGNPKDHEFVCDYRAMKGWYGCSTPDDRECWLRHKNGRRFDINTNYEKIAPVGTTRHYYLNITDNSFNADGQLLENAKLFNETYPGPWLEACWGDTVSITVSNYMNTSMEGTSIHWHGIRQNQTVHMDGVNGITQCPIAPGDSFTYTFKATQYGTSWYHSHYSVQYADGLLGPLTIHGPQSAPFDTSKRPLLMSDWTHVNAVELLFDRNAGNKTILLNGRGDVTQYRDDNKVPYVNTEPIPEKHEWHFNRTQPGKKPVKYLLRLINTSFDSTFVFSIDNHILQIVSADFVPIVPYHNTSVLIGIGQRYNVIVEADPATDGPNEIPADGNFWIRTWVAGEIDGECGVRPGGKGYEQTGILRYNETSTTDPTSSPWDNISKKCSDETYTSLKPKIPWTIGEAANVGPGPDKDGEEFDVNFKPGFQPKPYRVATFSLQRSGDPGFTPLRTNHSDPILMHLDDSEDSYPPEWVVIPENFTDEEWIYLVLTMNQESSVTRAHPIHLHGHDFALLQQVENQTYSPSKLNLKLDNPPRRDVVLLPNGGFVVIAFKSDNPGSWLMHCHIARHASEGLALQILERQSDANRLFPPESPAMIEANRVCAVWKRWQESHPELFDGDSGI